MDLRQLIDQSNRPCSSRDRLFTVLADGQHVDHRPLAELFSVGSVATKEGVPWVGDLKRDWLVGNVLLESIDADRAKSTSD